MWGCQETLCVGHLWRDTCVYGMRGDVCMTPCYKMRIMQDGISMGGLASRNDLIQHIALQTLGTGF